VFIAISITALTIIVGTKTFEGVTVKNAYEKGLQWDSTTNARIQSGWSVHITNKEIRTGDNYISIEITDKDKKPVRGAAVSITVSRPSTSEYDSTYRTVENPDGGYHTTVTIPLYGYWDFRKEVTLNGKSVVFEEKIYVQ